MTTHRIRRLALAFASLLFFAAPDGYAQVPARVYGQSNGLCDPGNVENCVKPNPDGSLSVSGTFSASLGGFAPNGNYASRSVSATSANVALPAGATVVVYNTGSVDAYVALGTSNAVAATTANDVVKAGAAIALAPGSNTYIAAITASGSTNLTMSGGAGLYSGVAVPTVIKLTDGSNVPGVAPASTAPTASQPALVVGLSPNSAGLTTQATNSAAISISTGTTTQLVALTSGKAIYVTAWDVIAAGTGNIELEYGTGSNCGTGTTALTGNYNITAQTGISKGSGVGPVLFVPAGNALCALTSAAVGMYGSVSYTQF